LVSQPAIKSVRELKGKIVGISSRGGSNDLIMQMMLEKNGLVPNKDVTALIVGTQPKTVIALRTGRIAAALLTPPRTQREDSFDLNDSNSAKKGDSPPWIAALPRCVL
jgi:ABC-type nitrate/sulfonate/bicarbonate transport system substrate-binding protein